MTYPPIPDGNGGHISGIAPNHGPQPDINAILAEMGDVIQNMHYAHQADQEHLNLYRLLQEKGRKMPVAPGPVPSPVEPDWVNLRMNWDGWSGKPMPAGMPWYRQLLSDFFLHSLPPPNTRGR